MTAFNITIISDTVCPWCYIGYRRLTRAITTHQTTHPTDTFHLTWQPFYLNASAPGAPGVEKQVHYAAKFGPERTAAIFERVAAVGHAEGITFSFGGRTGNTRDSHRLVWYAGEKEKNTASEAKGLQTRVVENLFRAYFEEEGNVTERGVLTEAGVAAGLDRRDVEALLHGEEGRTEVDAEADKARRQLVTGVPYFMVQGMYAVEGAEEPETFLEIFARVKQAEGN